MRTTARQRFVSNVNMSGFVQSGVMHTIARNGHHVQKRFAREVPEETTDIKAGITVVGSACRVGGKRK